MKLRLALCVVLLCVSPALFAQDTASITGTVTDSSGATVANAQVTVTSNEHGIHLTSPTNNSGEYFFSSLPIGSIDMTVTSAGFKKYEAKGIILQVAQKARNDVKLEVGSENVQVTVEGSNVAQVETQSSELGNVVTGKEISQLELNGRNFSQLITLVPGVTNQTGQDEAGVGVSGSVSFSVNGGRTEYNNWELDGGDALDNGSNTTLNVYPSIDAIGEFKVLTSNYGAQYGKSGSGTVEVETKSGTSSFHGNVYEFLRNDAFNAVPTFQTSVPEYKKNDFGFTIGGPIYIPKVYNTNKQKSFFFYSEEWRRDIVPATGFFSQTTVPSVAERGGDFADVCGAAGVPFQTSDSTMPAYFPNCPSSGALPPPPPNQPQMFNTFPNNQVGISDPTTVNALEGLIPLPNQGANSWFATPSLPTHWREELFRIDHNVNDKIRANFHYIHDSWDQAYPVPLWTSGTSFPTVQTNFVGPGISLLARISASASPTLLNEFVASYTTDHIVTHLTGAWQRPQNFAPIGIYANDFGGKVPGIDLTGNQYNFFEDPGYVPNGPLNSNPTVTFRDSLTKVIGSHNLLVGLYVVLAKKNEIPQPGTGTNGYLTFDPSQPVSSGNAFADLLLGNVAGFQQQKAAFKVHEQYNILEPYIQDDWHATKRLTLNLGIRFSFYGPYSEKNHLAYNFDPRFYVTGASSIDPTSGLVIGNPQNGWVQCGVQAGVPASCFSNKWLNPAPRIGFAYDPFGDGKWALRGGYGIFFEHTNGNESNTEALEPFNPATQTSSVFNIVGYQNITPALLGGSSAPLSFDSIASKGQWPYVQQYHLDVEHDLGKSTVATLSYVGTLGVHLTRSYEFNQVHPVPPGQTPYSVGQPINDDPNSGDCSTVSIDPTTSQSTATVNGNTTTGSWANNLAVACGIAPDLYRPFAGIGSIVRKDFSGASNYNALEGSVRHTVGGLELSFAYTYSHSIDDSSDYNDAGFVNSYNLNAYRASSNFDQRHNFEISYVYDLPILKGKTLTDKLLGGWQWSGISNIESGSPFSVYSGNTATTPSDNAGVSNAFATGGSYPDIIGDPKAGIPHDTLAGYGHLLYNPSAFVAPTGLTFGDAGRNILRNPWRTNFDMALLKHFTITESKYVEFRAEAFNVFNHTEYSYLGGDAGSAASNSVGGSTSANTIGCYAGNNNSAGDPSCSPLGLLRPNSAHNTRILQLALKLFF